ncbi:MAG: hypothetical protein H0Z39_04260 [Peptococcaceae bacterium]|nr:hypothetical protein [Peptococcaceae bacterium]
MRRFLVLLLIIIVLAFWYALPRNSREEPWTIPHLPRPVAEKRILITSAGQSTDGLIIAQMIRDLHLSYSYRRKAYGNDFSQWFASLILVLGYSHSNLQKVNLSFTEEIERVQSLVDAAHRNGRAVIVVHLGGKNRRGYRDDVLISRFAPQADYLIVVKEGNYDNIFGRIASQKGIPLTICKDIRSIKPPLNSAYR